MKRKFIKSAGFVICVVLFSRLRNYLGNLKMTFADLNCVLDFFFTINQHFGAYTTGLVKGPKQSKKRGLFEKRK